MLISRRFEPPDLVVASLGGIVTAHDQADLTQWIRASMRRAGPVRLLIRLETFAGWLPQAPLENIAWLDDDDVAKMAIVGSAKWKLMVLTLLAAPVRALPIEYFESEPAARAWLERESIPVCGDPV